MKNSTRRQLVKWYLEGRTLPEIAERASEKYRTPVTVQTIYHIIQGENRLLQKRDINDRRVLILSEIAKIDNLEVEAWNGYFRSISGSTDTTTEKVTAPDVNGLKSDQIPNSENRLPKLYDIDDSAIGEDDDGDDVSSDDEQESIFGGWARIERRDGSGQSGSYGASERYGRSTSNSNSRRRGKSKSRRNNYEFISAADYDREEVDQPKPPQFSFTRKITKTCGDTKFLAVVQWCIDRRAKLLGLDAPTTSITATANMAQMKQMAREIATERGLDPDLVVEDVVADAERFLKAMRAPVED